MTEQRSQFRFPIERRAFLKYDGNTYLCDLLDLTDLGLKLRTEILIPVGATIQLECQLEAHAIIHCAVLITHSSHPYIGGQITEILLEHKRQLTQFMQKLIAAHSGDL
jgi:hypothetical protein